MNDSRYEAMRTDPANWKLGSIYYCPDDPRVVVRNLLPVGWTWNFGHPFVLPAIALAVAVFLAPPALAWWLGARSAGVLAAAVATGLAAVVFASSRLARDPET